MAILLRITLSCPSCGASFHPHSKGAGRPPQKYCSAECATPERTKSRLDPETRFWRKVDKAGEGGCWNWTAGTNVYGYGAFGVEPKRIVLAHRYSYEQATGEIAPGACVLHSCDNRRCVNPEHLRVGTKAENSRDMVDRNRSSSGERAVYSKLSSQDVVAIRSDPRTHGEIAKQYCVSQSVISRIKSRRTWKHVP